MGEPWVAGFLRRAFETLKLPAESGIDSYTRAASAGFEVPYDEITPAMCEFTKRALYIRMHERKIV